jgi:hypothetical protein
MKNGEDYIDSDYIDSGDDIDYKQMGKKGKEF